MDLGGIGQPLSLLCNPLISHLSLYDIVNTPGIAVDLSHISTSSQVVGYLPSDNGLEKALTGSDIVIIAAVEMLKYQDLFATNSKIVYDLAKVIAKCSPDAFILIISNPVNSIVPIITQVLKDCNVLNPRKLFGVTTLDIVRLSKFITEYVSENVEPGHYTIPVVGGHSGMTIIPLISQSDPKVELSEEQLRSLIHKVQYAGDEVVKAKDRNGSATLSMAYSAFILIDAILKIGFLIFYRSLLILVYAKTGVSGIVQCSFVYLPGISGGNEIMEKINNLSFFSVPLVLGKDGIEKVHSFDFVFEIEKQLLKTALPEIRKDIDKGLSFYTEYSK
ncbi:unnamed protein product [Pneumocystis jirovecii]|uniref:malate dehydrogenase n=1 Tax=Pneumocystis jirovecii TaxID=42068 RepID=L0PE61_PNEJI|nr:unnamed protein product [Pneumocystis jirovecii]